MEGSFGSRLRTQREQLQIPLGTIAERTKIKASLLEALERDDVSQWPTGIFRRSFVKAYAHAIGLDCEAVLREFLDLYPEPPEEDVAAVLAAAREGRRPPTRLGYLISSAISRVAAAKRSVHEPSAEAADADSSIVSPAEARLHDRPAKAGLYEAQTGPAEAGLYETQTGSAEVGLDSANAVAADETTSGATHIAMDDVESGFSRTDKEPQPELSVVAGLCTRLACAQQPRDVALVLEESTRVLNAVGVIVWMWDPTTRMLGHVLAHGYSCDVLARLPRVRSDADNAIADAFRSGETRVVSGGGAATGAVVVPMMTATGCAGVLALELHDRGEEREWVRAIGTILAAQFSGLFAFQSVAEAVSA